MASFAARLKKLVEITKIQTSDGNGNANAYMHGLANGLILAQAIMEEKDVDYLRVTHYSDAPRVVKSTETI